MRGLYAITGNNFISADALLDQVGQALAGGAVAIQYRDKKSPGPVREQTALALQTLCRVYGSRLIINDDVGLAQRINADGVHLGREDASLNEARSHLGPAKIIGVSCYADIDLAQQAERDGADYVAFGRFFPSRTKPDASPVTLDVLQTARERLKLPIVAIGGITAENGAPLVQAGADMLAVVGGVFAQDDVMQAARQISALLYHQVIVK